MELSSIDMIQMSPLFTFLLLLQRSECCRLSGEDDKPKVTPTNSTHVQISWEGAFSGCSDKNVKKIFVRFPSQSTNVKVRLNDDVKFSMGSGQFKFNPCCKQSFSVTLQLENETYLSSNTTWYNKIDHETPENNYKHLYGGSLHREVVNRSCLKENNTTVIIPDIPLALENCILKKEIKESEILGQGLKIKFTVVNPENEEKYLVVEAPLDALNACPDFTFQNSVLAVVVGLSASVLVAAIVTIMFLCYRKSRSGNMVMSVDENPVYGHSEGYYLGRERTQVEDTSLYYGVRDECWEDFVTDRNTYYQ